MTVKVLSFVVAVLAVAVQAAPDAPAVASKGLLEPKLKAESVKLKSEPVNVNLEDASPQDEKDSVTDAVELSAAVTTPSLTTAVEHSAAVTSPSLTTAAEMEAAITDLMLGKSAFGATPMGGSVKKITDILDKTMMPKVVDAHKSDQSNLNRLAIAIGRCGSTKDSGLRASRGLTNAYKSYSRTHQRCRNGQAVTYSSQQSCLIRQRSLYDQKKLKCDFFAATSKKLGTQKNNGEVAKKAASETTEGYITRMSATVCGRHNHGKKGTTTARGGWGGGLPNSFLDQYLKAKDQCERAKRAYANQVRLCKAKVQAHLVKRSQCNQYQGLMDSNSCKGAIMVKDACEAYAGCYDAKKSAFDAAWRIAQRNEVDRKAEWRGLKRMSCLMKAFADGKVSNREVDTCKKATVSTKFLTLKKPAVPARKTCALPTLYPATGAYKRKEFAPLPMLAKGLQAQECTGMRTVSTTPNSGSPRGTRCTRMALNGVYSAGALLKCTNGIDARRSYQKNSCPKDTKLFSPASRSDWRTFFASGGSALRSPHWIVDITRPQNGCGGCRSAMNSKNKAQKSWRTSDGTAWWLRSSGYGEPNGDYHANCFLSLNGKNENSITFNDWNCNTHSRSYYCQPVNLNLKPKTGSPASCRCSKVELAGKYSSGMLVQCTECLDVRRSTQKNSCPNGMKIFSPQTRQDWTTVLNSAQPLRAPHFIVDVTRPQNGCGGCTKFPMKQTTPQQATWKTSDGSPWWLRSTVFGQPSGDYSANCYMRLYKATSADTIQMNDYNCNYHSRSYFCQPKRADNKYAPAPPPPAPRQQGFHEQTFYNIKNMKSIPNLNDRRVSRNRVVKTVTYGNTGGKWSGFSAKDNFAVRWTGLIQINKRGNYKWRIGSDDGSRLYISNRVVVDNNGLHSYRNKVGSKSVAGGKSIKLEFFEKGGHAGMRFAYSGADTRNVFVYVGGCCSKVYPVAPRPVRRKGGLM